MARREAIFGDDLAASWAAWRQEPALPMLTVVIAAAATFQEIVGPGGFVVALPASIFLCGWAGTQRIWYLRIFRGGTLDRDLLWRMTLAFVGRYLFLGLLGAIPFSLLLIPVVTVEDPVARGLVFIPFVFAADFVLTFVTPALAFSTRHVFEALSIGWRTLWDGWPTTAPYALVAPLVVVGVGQLLSRTLGVGTIALTLTGTLLSLLFKGATAAYYMRHHHVPEYGAAV